MKLYLQFLFQRWKILTFAIAYLALLYFGTLAGDPTWDFSSATIMSALTSLTAPWVVGVIFLCIRRQKFEKQFLLALLLWICSVTVSYDLYVYVKTGFPAEATFENFLISSSFYFMAGLFWNIGSDERKMIFSFQKENWLSVDKKAPVIGILVLGGVLALTYLLILIGLVYGA